MATALHDGEAEDDYADPYAPDEDDEDEAPQRPLPLIAGRPTARWGAVRAT